MRGARAGRFYYADPDGGGVYTLTRFGDEYCITFLPRHPDGQVAWESEQDTGEVDFFRIEPELRQQALEAGKLLCKRAGLSPAMTREVLRFADTDED